MGWPVTMIVLVTLERDNGRIVDELIRKFRAAAEVIDVWYVTGDHDLVLHVAAQNMSTYDAFTRRVLHAEEHVRSFKTLVVLQHPERAAPLPPAVSV
jgi:Lrp/AsnC family transcriptional regulator, leucine-responsive regulatory protein